MGFQPRYVHQLTVGSVSAYAEQRTEKIERCFHPFGPLPYLGSDMFVSCDMSPVFWAVC